MMKKYLVAMIAVTTLLLYALAWANSVTIRYKEDVGEYLADGRGIALYYFKQDSAGKSSCTGDCLAAWPLFYDEQLKTPQGLAAGDFGVIVREDGTMQTTYKGYPLYYYVKDRIPGEVLGHGADSAWFAVNPKAFKS